jgi:hypothetical protein
MRLSSKIDDFSFSESGFLEEELGKFRSHPLSSRLCSSIKRARGVSLNEQQFLFFKDTVLDTASTKIFFGSSAEAILLTMFDLLVMTYYFVLTPLPADAFQ